MPEGNGQRKVRVEGIARITHHDLRHMFATRCIESGVDIPTLSFHPQRKPSRESGCSLIDLRHVFS